MEDNNNLSFFDFAMQIELDMDMSNSRSKLFHVALNEHVSNLHSLKSTIKKGKSTMSTQASNVPERKLAWKKEKWNHTK